MAGRPERRGDGVVALIAVRVLRMESGAVVHRHGGPGRPVDAAPVWREIFWGEEGLGKLQCSWAARNGLYNVFIFWGELNVNDFLFLVLMTVIVTKFDKIPELNQSLESQTVEWRVQHI